MLKSPKDDNAMNTPDQRTKRSLIKPLFTAAFLVCMTIIIHPMQKIDNVWSDIILTSEKLPVDERFLIVEVTPQDIQTFGGPPVPRDTLGEAFKLLSAGGARRMMVDMHFSKTLSTGTDESLVSGMASFGPERLAIARSQILPDVKFQSHASLADTRISPDTDGWTRNAGYGRHDGGINPAHWLATGEASHAKTSIDLRYDPKSVERISISDVLNDPSRSYEGRIIVLGNNSILAPGRTYLPLSDESGRSAIFVLGSQSIMTNHADRKKLSDTISIGFSFLLAGLGFLAALKINNARLLILVGFAMVCTITAVNMALIEWLGSHTIPTVNMASYLIGAFTIIINRLNIIPMVAGFVKGDLSPEQAWAWRAYQDSPHPVILLDAMGGVRRQNAQAESIQDLLGDNIGEACMPEFGKHAAEITLTDPDGADHIFALDWPNRSIPIIVMKNITEKTEQVRALRDKLMTDPVSGLLSRAGFDAELEHVGPGTDSLEYVLFFMDMNGFKAVNDTYGHEAGDDLLRIVGERLGAKIRKSDALCRLGGDEFAVLMRGRFSADALLKMAINMEEAVKLPINLPVATVHVGIAIGYALPETPEETVAAVLNRADHAMYERKRIIKGIAA